MIHELKCWPQYFRDVIRGIKTFEIRLNDRNFKIGDQLILREYGMLYNEYTGESLTVEVMYILLDDKLHGLEEGYCIMSIKKV